jgi:hypothetical protein
MKKFTVYISINYKTQQAYIGCTTDSLEVRRAKALATDPNNKKKMTVHITELKKDPEAWLYIPLRWVDTVEEMWKVEEEMINEYRTQGYELLNAKKYFRMSSCNWKNLK